MRFERIKSSKNTIIRQTAKLKNKKYRDELSRYLVEGGRFVMELSERQGVAYLIMSKSYYRSCGGLDADGCADIKPDLAQGLPQVSGDTVCYVVDDFIFEAVSDTKTPQGVLAVVRKDSLTLGNIPLRDTLSADNALPAADASIIADASFTDSNRFVVVCDDVRDPGNLGSIIRSADAFGAAGVIVSDGSADIYNPKVLRSTMGSIFHLPVVTGVSTAHAITYLQRHGVITVAAYLSSTSEYLHESRIQGSVAIIIGNEANGISDTIAAMCDKLIMINMPGSAESLNASAAAAVMMYHFSTFVS